MIVAVAAPWHEEKRAGLDGVAITLGALVSLVGAGWNPRRFALRWIEVASSAEGPALREELHSLGLRISAVYLLSDGRKIWLIAEADG